jgi:hypothetical protein
MAALARVGETFLLMELLFGPAMTVLLQNGVVWLSQHIKGYSRLIHIKKTL